LLEGLARFEAYDPQAAASEMDGRRESGKTVRMARLPDKSKR
jgi:hypothetical protein